jgi:hypothetical protein
MSPSSTLAARLARMPSPLRWGFVAHACLALACLVALCVPATPVLGVHPALKPLKFALSISMFLATMGQLLPAVSVAPAVRSALAWVLASTMVAEMSPIVVQGLRGTSSHFNVQRPLDAVVWSLMVLAIVVATGALICVVVLATVRPLTDRGGQVLHPLLTFAWRAGAWLLLLAPISGFAMGARLQHSVGGADGGIGLPFVNWSVLHGDLRVAHFFALHAVQLLPLLAWLSLRLLRVSWLRWGALGLVTLGATATCVGTLAQAFAGRPFIESRAPPR